MIPDTTGQFDLQSAVALHQSGRLMQAASIYKQVLDVDPKNGDALHLLGLVFHQSGQPTTAVKLIKRALEVYPNQSDFLRNLADILKESGQFEKSVQIYRRIIELHSGSNEVYNSLGISLSKLNLLEEAIRVYQHAIRFDPKYVPTYNHMGMSFAELGQFDKAMSVCKKAIELDHYNYEAYNTLGNIYTELGQLENGLRAYQKALDLNPCIAELHFNYANVLKLKGKLKESVSAYQRAIVFNSNYSEAYYNLGTLLQKQGKLEESVSVYQKVLAINPNYAEVYNNLGHMLHKQRKLDGAFQFYQKAISLKPDFVVAYRNLGDVLSQQGKIEQAIQSYDKAIEIQPDNAQSHHHRGMLLLLQGDFQRGWKEYEWRLKCNDFPVEKRSFAQPVWDGSPLNGKTIFLYAEQGFGDTIQFIRYVYELTWYKVDIIVECQSELLDLFRNIGIITQLIVQGDALPDFDVHAPLLSLPRILGTDLESIPSKAPYLSARPVPVFSSNPNSKLKVGIAWAGNSWHPNDDTRSVDLEQFTILFNVSACQFYSLQVGDRRNDIFKCNYSIPLIDLGANFSDFSDTASAIIELDLVISVDTSVAHLAGALGKNVWVLLSWIPDWRWLLEKEDTLWYPTMRLFRQTRNGDWESAFQQLQLALKRYVLKSRDIY